MPMRHQHVVLLFAVTTRCHLAIKILRFYKQAQIFLSNPILFVTTQVKTGSYYLQRFFLFLHRPTCFCPSVITGLSE